MKRKREGFCASFPKNVIEFLAEQRSDKCPDFREIKSHQNACDGTEQFWQAVNFHIGYLVFFGFPFVGAGFFFAAGFAGALEAGFPLTGALGGGAV